jgi:hypothetical protein
MIFLRVCRGISQRESRVSRTCTRVRTEAFRGQLSLLESLSSFCDLANRSILGLILTVNGIQDVVSSYPKVFTVGGQGETGNTTTRVISVVPRCWKFLRNDCFSREILSVGEI